MGFKLKTGFDGILKIDFNGDIIWVPNDENNGDWLYYQRWLAAGNTPQAADPE